MIYDCFTFLNEFDLLEIRLNSLNSCVDKFVLVESLYTFSGKKKPLYYEEVKNDPLFVDFKDKIEHVVVKEKPFQNVWKTEWHQKNAAARGLKNLKDDDIVIFSDMDELIRASVFPIINKTYAHSRVMLKLFYYYFNCRANREAYKATAFCRYKDFTTIKNLRRPGKKLNVVKNGGWHFSYLMSPEKIAEKIESFSHTEYDSEYFKDPDRILKCMEAGVDLYERKGKLKFRFVAPDVPKYVEDNLDRFSKYIKPL